jgi:hypothetical protein
LTTNGTERIIHDANLTEEKVLPYLILLYIQLFIAIYLYVHVHLINI